MLHTQFEMRRREITALKSKYNTSRLSDSSGIPVSDDKELQVRSEAVHSILMLMKHVEMTEKGKNQINVLAIENQ